jgi:hypothetical protein
MDAGIIPSHRPKLHLKMGQTGLAPENNATILRAADTNLATVLLAVTSAP